MIHAASPARTALVGFLALAVAMGIGRFVFTPLLPLMEGEGLLSLGGGGLLASVHFLGYAMGAFAAIWLGAPPRPALFASLAVIAVATAAMSLSDSFALWLAARWLAGACSALVLVLVGTHVVARLAEAGRPGLQGAVFAGVGGGIAAAGLVTLWLMAAGIDSGPGWLIFGLASLAATAAIWALARRPVAEAASRSIPRPAAKTPLEWKLIVAYGAMGAGYIIPATYLPAMGRALVPDPAVFGWCWPVFGAAAAASTLVAARLHARFSNRRIWAAGQAVMAVGVVLPAVWPHIAAVVAAGVCVGGTFMVVTMAGLKEALRIAGPGGAQRHVAALTAAFATGQMIAPVLAGWAYDAAGSLALPLVLAGALLATTAAPLLMPERAPSAATPAPHRPG